VIVTIRHMRSIPGFNKRAGFCIRGARTVCESLGFDWRDAVRNGIDAEQLAATGNGFALALVKWARECDVAEKSRG
jgi:hypothetical protein